jgi:hypothetical protein
VPQQRVEPAVEALADGGEAPAVLAVEVRQHHRPFRAELRAVERVARDLLAPRDDAEVPGGDLGHRPVTVDGGGEGEAADGRRHAVEGDPERLGVARLGAQELEGLLGGLRLVVEDEVPVVGEPFVGVQAETADVEAQSGPGDLHAHVQIGTLCQVAEPGLLAPLKVSHHT